MAGGHGSALAASFVDIFRWNCQPLGEKHRNNEANVIAPDLAVGWRFIQCECCVAGWQVHGNSVASSASWFTFEVVGSHSLCQ